MKSHRRYRQILRTAFWLVCLISVVLILDGCSYRLRGSHGAIAPMPATIIEGLPVDRPVVMEVRRLLLGSGTRVVDEPGQAEAKLILSNETQERRVLSVGTTGKVREYELHYGLLFEVRDKDGKLRLPQQSIDVKRDFSFDGTDVLGKEQEQQMLYDDLHHEAAAALLQRLQAISWSP